MKIYNLGYLNEISGGDRDFIYRMVNEFIAQAPESLTSIWRHVKGMDYNSLWIQMHQFAPQLDFIGLSDCRLMADQVESLCKSKGDWELIMELVKQIDASASTAVSQLQIDFLSKNNIN